MFSPNTKRMLLRHVKMQKHTNDLQKKPKKKNHIGKLQRFVGRETLQQDYRTRSLSI